MTTIEERANAWAVDRCEGIVSDTWFNVLYEKSYADYKSIASEQLQIDLEKIIDYIENLMPQDATREDIVEGIIKVMKE